MQHERHDIMTAKPMLRLKEAHNSVVNVKVLSQASDCNIVKYDSCLALMDSGNNHLITIY